MTGETATRPLVSGLPVLVFLALALLYAGPGLLPGRVLVPMDGLSDVGLWKADPNTRAVVSNGLLSDVLFQFVPWDTEARRQIRNGAFPWINPYASQGRPLWANPQTALLSPFTWPRLIFGLRGWALAVLLKLLVAGCGAYALARELSASRREALVSGAVYLTAGFTIVWALHPHTNVSAVLPGLLAALLALRREPRGLRAVVVAGLAALATAGGHPETLALGACGLVAFVLWDAAAGRSLRRDAGILAISLGGLAAGFLLVAVEIVPFLRLLPSTAMAAHRSLPGAVHFRWPAVAGQILPGAFGSPLAKEIDLTGAVSMRGGAVENFNWRNSTYVGALALAAILLAGRKLAPRLRRARLAGFVALAIVWRLPILAATLHRVPLLGLAVPEWWGSVAVMFLAVAVGPAIAVLGSVRRPRTALAFAAAGAILVAAGTAPALKTFEPILRRAAQRRIAALQESGFLKLPPRVYDERMNGYLARARWTAVRRVAFPGVAFLVFGVGLAARRRRREILAAAALGELLAFGLGYDPAIRAADVPSTPDAIVFLQKSPLRTTSFVAAAPGAYPPNLATRDGLRDVRSYDVLESRAEVDRLRECGYSASDNAFPPRPDGSQQACLSRLGVRWYLTREDLPGTRRVAGDPPPRVGVYELAGAAAVPFPADAPPAGVTTGAVLSLFGLLLGLAMAVIAERGRQRRPIPER